jgi:hypothetical protein
LTVQSASTVTGGITTGSAAVASGSVPITGALSVTSTSTTATALDVFASGAMTGNVIYGHVQSGVSGQLLEFSEGGNALMSVRMPY